MQRTLLALALYCLVAFGISWALIGGLIATGHAGSETSIRVVLIFYFLGPAIAALVTHAWLKRPFDIEALDISPQPTPWVLLAWALPAVLAFAILFLQKLFPGVVVSFDPAAHIQALPTDATEEMRKQYEQAKSTPAALFFVGFFTQALFFGVLLKLLPSILAELGWRGVLLRLLAPFGFWPAVLVMGVLVGVWNLPVVFVGGLYPGAARAGFFLVLGYTVLMAPLATYFRLMGGSIITSGVFIAAVSSFEAFIGLFVVAGSSMYVGFEGIAGLIVLLVANLIFVVPGWREADAALRALAPARV